MTWTQVPEGGHGEGVWCGSSGAAHSSCLDTSGAVLTWRSADPALAVQEVGGALAGKRIVAISAGGKVPPLQIQWVGAWRFILHSPFNV